MAIKRYQIHYKTKGSLGQDEDEWTLVVDTDTGERKVEHWWHHMNPYKGIVNSTGKNDLTLAEFEGGEHGGKLAAALAEADKNA